ncbi:hypothetical protein Tco_1492043 [Tanacetum coccineum]
MLQFKTAELLFLAGEQVTNFDNDVDDLALNVDHVFEADQCDAFDSDVDEAPTTQTNLMMCNNNGAVLDEDRSDQCDAFDSDVDEAPTTQTMFMANLTSEEAGHLMTRIIHLRDSEVQQKNMLYKVEDRLFKQDQSVQMVHMLCRPKPFYDEKNKVAIGYKNPLCLTRAKQVQSALYDGNEIVRTNHAPAVVHDSDDTLEIAEITRKRMLEKVKSHFCVEHKVKFAPPDYSKENYLAIFTPQRDLTPKQIFWSKDENDRKKAKTSVLKPLSTPTVYPPNTPVKLVPGVLPTKSQEAPDFNSFFKIKNLEHQTQEKDNVIRDLKVLVSKMNDRSKLETLGRDCKDARVVKPLDNVLNSCKYTKLSQELVEYVIGTCPKEFTERDNKAAAFIPLTRKKQVTFTDTCSTSTNNTQKHGVHQKAQQSNVQVIPSTGVSSSTRASGSKPRSNTKHNRILPAKSANKKKVEDHPRTNKSVWTKVNRVDSSISSKRVVINSNSESVCKTCNKCLNSANHEMCVVNILNSVNATPTVKTVLNNGKQIWKPKGKLSNNSLNKTKRVWKATGKLFTNVGYQWRPTGKKFTLGKLNCGYQWRPTGKKFALGELSCGTDHLMVFGLRLFKTYDGESLKAQELCEKVHQDGNNHVGAIMGYGDYMIGDSVVSWAYYVEGLGHNLFSVGKFCDSDLEVAFRKYSCFGHNMDGVDLLKS